MWDVLRDNNLDLLRQVDRLQEDLEGISSSLLTELRAYYQWAVEAVGACGLQARQNLEDLELRRDEILPDILSNTQVATRELALLNQRLLSPLLRARPSDRLCLKLLLWLHSAHAQTDGLPLGLTDGEFAAWPVPDQPTVYFMPPSAQRELLYLPLFFHEFGHLLYACHAREMDDLIRDLQEQIRRMLAPRVQRDDAHDRAAEQRRTAIVERWYEWTQELFCDAVGYVIGGRAFVEAFSMYLRMRGSDEYRVPLDQLLQRHHPVTWLRARLLADRACRMGYSADGEVLTGAWDAIAEAMGVVEDYFGFYEPEFGPAVHATIEDMLTEASPRKCTSREVGGSDEEFSPIGLVNEAWRRFREDPQGYRAWEERAVSRFLGGA